MQNRSGAYSYSPPCIQNISGIFLFPSLHTEHIRHIFIPFPRMQTEPEHVFDCPHVCDGCTVRTDAIRHERTDVRKTRWTMKMYSGSASYRESSNLPLSPIYRESNTLPLSPTYRESSNLPLSPTYRESNTLPLSPTYRESNTLPLSPTYRESNTLPLSPTYRESSNLPLSPTYRESTYPLPPGSMLSPTSPAPSYRSDPRTP